VGTTEAHRVIRSSLNQAGYTETPGPDLDRETADPSYIWQQLTQQHQDVLWIEAHGSKDQALTALPLEQIARMHSAGTDDWGRISPRLIVFGSCNAAHSPLLRPPSLMAYLIDTPAIVVAASRPVDFDEVEPYRALIQAWLSAHDGDEKQRPVTLRQAAPDLFDTVLLIEPAFTD
jgi:hypothetical protein